MLVCDQDTIGFKEFFTRVHDRTELTWADLDRLDAYRRSLDAIWMASKEMKGIEYLLMEESKRVTRFINDYKNLR